MGNVDLTDSSGKLTTVDKTWAFVREPDGEIRIVLHHSSLPFVAKLHAHTYTRIHAARGHA